MNKTKPIKLNLYKAVTIARYLSGRKSRTWMNQFLSNRRLSDQPFVDNTLYGSGKDDSIS